MSLKSHINIGLLGMLYVCMYVCITAGALADDTPFKSTPYPVPRFVTLADEEVFVRTGPGKQYPIDWVFEQEGLPVEIVLEFENWRKIRDHEGQKGWVYGPLTSGRRNALTQIKNANEMGFVSLLDTPKNNSHVHANLEANVLLNLKACETAYCRVEIEGQKGWIAKDNLWGVYADEVFD